MTSSFITFYPQRFEFCGGLDCPDWILAQLYYASNVNLPEFELICQNVVESIKLDGNLDEVSLFNQIEQLRRINDNNDGFDIDDTRALFAAINFIITNTCIYQITSKTVCDELEQLGLTREHCSMLGQFLSEDMMEDIRSTLLARTS